LRSLLGHPVNAKEPLLGKIVLNSPWLFCDRNSVIATSSPNRKSLRHRAILTDLNDVDNYLKSSDNAIYYGVSNIKELNAGDIVRLTPEGKIDVLYEIESQHNVLFVTEQCNCSCLMCPQYTTRNRTDYTKEILALIRLIPQKTRSLGITGGEPTLLGDNLFRIIEACKQKLPKTALQLLSNGIRFADFEFTKNFVLIGHPNIQIGIPLYADTDTEHNYIVQTNGFYKTLKGIQNLALFNQRIEIRIVITALNYRRLPKLAEFIYRNLPFAIHIAFMGMETRELAKKNLEQVWVDPYEYQNYLEEAVEFLSLRQMKVSVYNHQLCVLPKSLWPYSIKSISTWKNIYLPECEQCQKKELCGGFFESSAEIHSKHIHPLS
jgi:His-Xaa-Ser system radical SAM maturase HxsC